MIYHGTTIKNGELCSAQLSALVKAGTQLTQLLSSLKNWQSLTHFPSLLIPVSWITPHLQSPASYKQTSNLICTYFNVSGFTITYSSAGATTYTMEQPSKTASFAQFSSAHWLKLVLSSQCARACAIVARLCYYDDFSWRQYVTNGSTYTLSHNILTIFFSCVFRRTDCFWSLVKCAPVITSVTVTKQSVRNPKRRAKWLKWLKKPWTYNLSK